MSVIVIARGTKKSEGISECLAFWAFRRCHTIQHAANMAARMPTVPTTMPATATAFTLLEVLVVICGLLVGAIGFVVLFTGTERSLIRHFVNELLASMAVSSCKVSLVFTLSGVLKRYSQVMQNGLTRTWVTNVNQHFVL
jgi:hypothetical protein